MKSKTVKTILLPVVAAIVTSLCTTLFTLSKEQAIWSDEKNYSLKYADMKQKEKLYEEVIDIYQVIHNDLLPNLEAKVQAGETQVITNKFANIMNRCILYFDESLAYKIEGTMKPNYWERINTEDMITIMQGMVNEIKTDRERLKL